MESCDLMTRTSINTQTNISISSISGPLAPPSKFLSFVPPLETKVLSFATWTLLSLQVSDILLQPGSGSGPDWDWDSGVALLQLQDKAKISEGSLPVCLPEGGGGGAVEAVAAAPAQEAYGARWVLAGRRGDAPSRQTRLVRVGVVSQCARRSAAEPLCVTGEPPPPQRASAALVPGITIAPAARYNAGAGAGAGLSEASGRVWQLLGLEGSSPGEWGEGEGEGEGPGWQPQTRVSHFRDWIETNIK